MDPEYEAAAAALTFEDNILLAKVDSEEDEEIAERFDIGWWVGGLVRVPRQPLLCPLLITAAAASIAIAITIATTATITTAPLPPPPPHHRRRHRHHRTRLTHKLTVRWTSDFQMVSHGSDRC